VVQLIVVVKVDGIALTLETITGVLSTAGDGVEVGGVVILGTTLTGVSVFGELICVISLIVVLVETVAEVVVVSSVIMGAVVVEIEGAKNPANTIKIPEIPIAI